MLSRILAAATITAALSLTGLTPAHADLFYLLDQNGCTTTCSPSPYGVVDLHQVNPTTVMATLTLANGAEFVATGAGDALTFNIAGDPHITVTDLTTGFAVDPHPPVHASTFGYFDYGIICTVPTGCGNGGSHPNPGPLTFTTTDGSNLSITDFVANVGGYFFASDIIAGNGATGNVASNHPGTSVNPLGDPVPEPASLALLGVGLLGLSTVRQLRRASCSCHSDPCLHRLAAASDEFS